MLKILLRTVMILLVAGLVAGCVYLFAQNSGTSLLGLRGGARPGEFTGITTGIGLAQPDGVQFAKGQRPAGGEFGHGDREGGGFSLMGLTALGMQLGKVAVITVVVVGFQTIMRLLKRRRHPARAAAA